MRVRARIFPIDICAIVQHLDVPHAPPLLAAQRGHLVLQQQPEMLLLRRRLHLHERLKKGTRLGVQSEADLGGGVDSSGYLEASLAPRQLESVLPMSVTMSR